VKKDFKVNVFGCLLSTAKPPFFSEFRYLGNAFTAENSLFVLKADGKKMVLETYIQSISFRIKISAQTGHSQTEINGSTGITKIP